MKKRRGEGSSRRWKKEREEEARARERQKKSSSCWQVYEYVRRICAHQHVDPYRDTWNAYALASLVSFKNPRSYRVSILLYHSPPLPPPVRRAVHIPDLEGCNKL